MKEYIEKNKALKEMKKWCNSECNANCVIENIPTAGVVPVVHAKWEETRYRDYDIQSCETIDCGVGFRCSNCSNVFKVTSIVRYHYCPNCGARMDGE